jgi:hypothetical protein
MEAFFDFAGAHPIVTVLLAVLAVAEHVGHAGLERTRPVEREHGHHIRELRRPKDQFKPR